MIADAVLFDLDGTLWNSVTGVSTAWQRVLDKYPGIRKPITDQEIADCMGFTMDEIAKKMFPSLAPDEQKLMLERCVEEEQAYLRQVGGKLYEGVEETLAKLAAKYPLAIVSNCQRGYIECFLDITGLKKYFCDYESFGNTGLEKGDNLLLVIKRLQSHHPVYVGDMIKDQLAAEYAHIPYIFADYGFGRGNLAPVKWDYRIKNFSQLLELL